MSSTVPSLSFESESAPGFTPVAVENPGGGRITDKRDPAREDLETVTGHRGRRVPLHKHAAAAWRAMLRQARAEGVPAPHLEIVSGYRSTARQRTLFRRAVGRYGSERAARRWVAPPGKSAHHSGRAVDLYLGYPIGSRYAERSRKTTSWRWLRDNARRYGFYPYEREPWHWEYNPPAGAAGTSDSGGIAGAAAAVASLPRILSSALAGGIETAKVAAAIANGQRDENALTNAAFFARHPERDGRRIQRHERAAAAEWLRIRDRIVRPLLEKISSATAGAASTAGAPADVPLARLIESRNGQVVWSYRFTPEDLLWTARLIVGEAGGRDDKDNAAVIRALMNRYALFTRRVFPSFAAFVRAYSTTLQPVLRSAGAARRHMHSSAFKRTGGYYAADPTVPKGQLRRHLELQATPWSRLPASARRLAARALSGQMPDPGIGLASEFASTRIYFRSHHGGREPTDAEWRQYTIDLARRKRWQWIGDVPGLNQRKNAFFLDNRARGRPASDVSIR